ncbi:MAG: hypothetical protein L6R39_001561 [Caloplaca ligustica]|nr:MAG: hypothetical protein L6R39_001561 [Caloplaca ligustica]
MYVLPPTSVWHGRAIVDSSEQAYDWEVDYEIYDRPIQYQAYHQCKPVVHAPIEKPAEEDIPGTDAWIEAQAARRKEAAKKKTPKKKRPKQAKPAVETKQANPSRAENGRGGNPVQNPAGVEEADEYIWSVTFHPSKPLAWLKPHPEVTMEDWEELLAGSHRVPSLQAAVKEHVETLQAWAASGISEAEARHEGVQKLLLRLPPDELTALREVMRGRGG